MRCSEGKIQRYRRTCTERRERVWQRRRHGRRDQPPLTVMSAQQYRDGKTRSLLFLYREVVPSVAQTGPCIELGDVKVMREGAIVQVLLMQCSLPFSHRNASLVTL